MCPKGPVVGRVDLSVNLVEDGMFGALKCLMVGQGTAEVLAMQHKSWGGSRLHCAPVTIVSPVLLTGMDM